MSLKDVKLNFLLDIAADLFMCRSVQEVTIRDLAVSAQVGEATIYRYFGTKQNIVIQVAMKLQAIVSNDFFKLEEGKTGYEKLAIFYQSYYGIFNKHPNFYNYIGACHDMSISDYEDIVTYTEEAVGVKRSEYINSGVLLMNMKKMRIDKFEEHFLDLLNTYHFDSIAPDQDYINAMHG